MDLAEVGFKVDTTGLEHGNESLDAFTKKVDESIRALNNQSDAAGKNNKAISDSARAYEAVADSLRFQTDQLTRTTREQTIMAAQRRAQVQEGSREADQIRTLAGAYFDLREQQEKVAKPGPIQATLRGIQGQMVALAGGAGLAGTALAAFGPAGIAAAAGLTLFNNTLERAKSFREFSRQIADGAEITSLSTDKFQALRLKALEAGVSFERFASMMSRFSIEQQRAATGGGALFDELRKINPELALQFARARDMTEALDVYNKALATTDQNTRNLLQRMAMGRGSADMGGALVATHLAGGVDAITNALAAGNKLVTEQMIEEQKKMAIRASMNAAQLDKEYGQAAAQIADKWKALKKIMGIDDQGMINLMVNVNMLLSDPIGLFKKIDSWIAAKTGFDANKILPEGVKAAMPSITVNKPEPLVPFGPPMPPPAKVLTPDEQRQKTINDMTLQLKLDKEKIALLGETATSTQIVKVKTDELNLANLTTNALTKQQKDLVVASYNAQAAAADLAIRSQYGLATQTEMMAVAEAQLQIQIARGNVALKERAQAEAFLAKQVRDRMEQQAVANSNLPGLKQMEIDASRLDKQLDTLSTSSLNAVTSSLLELGSGTKTAADAFRNLGATVTRALQEMLIKMIIIQPIAAQLQSILGGFAGGGVGGIFSSFFGGGAPNGGTISGAGAGALGGGIPTGPSSIIAHTGGIIGRDWFPTRQLPKYHGGGVAPDEQLAVLQKDEGVFTREQMKAMGGRGAAANVEVNVINQTGDGTSVEHKKKNAGGGREVHDVIIRSVNRGFTDGDIDPGVIGRFGTRPAKRRR